MVNNKRNKLAEICLGLTLGLGFAYGAASFSMEDLQTLNAEDQAKSQAYTQDVQNLQAESQNKAEAYNAVRQGERSEGE